MWPWEHLAVAYLAYSGLVHVRDGRGPTAGPTAVLVFGSQFPDLVDKPLAWGLGVLPSGWSLTHTLLVAVPLGVAVVAVTRHVGRPELGTAFVVGYLLHIPGDVFYAALLGGEPTLWFLVWPLVPAPPEATTGFLPRVERLFDGFVRLINSPRGLSYLFGEVVLLTSAFTLWLVDGAPVAASVSRVVRARLLRDHSR